jgi:hypothetical protein
MNIKLYITRKLQSGLEFGINLGAVLLDDDSINSTCYEPTKIPGTSEY